MTSAEDSSRPARPVPDRSRRVLVWWAVGLGLLAVLGLVCWLVVLPALQVARVAGSLQGPGRAGYFPDPAQASAAIEDLGGPEAAARKIGLYLRLSTTVTGRERALVTGDAAALLGYCGKPGLREIRILLDARSDAQRYAGWWALFAFTLADHRGQLPSGDLKENLQHAVETGDPEARRLVAEIVKIVKREWRAQGTQPMYPK